MQLFAEEPPLGSSSHLMRTLQITHGVSGFIKINSKIIFPPKQKRKLYWIQVVSHLEGEKEKKKKEKALKQTGLHGYGFPEPSDSLLPCHPSQW